MSSVLGAYFDALDTLSSGQDGNDNVIAYVFGFLKDAGDWAGAVAKLIGLVK